jgi:hypothetical protein
MESAEHAKTRVLIFIDRLVCIFVDRSNQTVDANITLARTRSRWNHARTIPPYCRMRAISEEHQAY